MSEGALERVALAVTSIATGATIPEPIRRNALRAFGRLFAAAVEIPASMLEGVADEKRALSQARVKLIEAAAGQIAQEMKLDPRFAEVASLRYGQKIVRQQLNLTRVGEVAASELLASSGSPSADDATTKSSTSDELDEDWLNAFEDEAAEKSTEQMQMVFGKILAGEIRKPKSFSVRTLRLIGQLDSRTAQDFKRLCSIAISLSVPGSRLNDVRACSLGGNAAANSLQTFGLSFDVLNTLHESGLVIADFNSYMDYGACVAVGMKVLAPLTFERRHFGLVPKGEQPVGREFRVHGVALSRSGKELFPIVDLEPDPKYHEALRAFLETSGLLLVPIAGGG